MKHANSNPVPVNPPVNLFSALDLRVVGARLTIAFEGRRAGVLISDNGCNVQFSGIETILLPHEARPIRFDGRNRGNTLHS